MESIVGLIVVMTLPGVTVMLFFISEVLNDILIELRKHSSMMAKHGSVATVS